LTFVKSTTVSKRQDCGERLIRIRRNPRGRAMNRSIATADRATHLKIVVVALLGAILTTTVAIALA
jgi:hypothetical protein